MGAIGLADDYLKIKRKDKEGLKGRFKIVGQITLGLIVGATLYLHPSVTIKQQSIDGKSFLQEEKSTKTTIPLLKNNEFDYSDVIAWAGEGAKDYAWIIFIPAVIFIITAVSNGANLTDGIDGLAAGTASIAVLTLGLFAWVSGNIIFADYLNVMYIPEVSEVVVFVAAFVGALVGFLWYNAYPAQVFMGDTGSLTIGGIIAVLALIVRKELLIPVLCGVFLIENLSVILQVSYFKYTKKRQGVGKRIFKMAPLHHHYQKLGYHESKIVSRFWIIAIMLAIISLVTLKIR
jgi:phospho-N-acetylmuramoyl-pentapeptide-transferase